MDWKSYKKSGQTEHRNWWPDCYQAASEHQGIAPEVEVMTYDTSYETVRADLKTL